MAEVLEAEEFRGRVLGIHLEGPFLCPEPGARGAHNPEWMQPGDLDLLKRLLDLAGGQTRVLTVAPEAEGAEKLARYAVDRGIAVSVSHTLAGPDDLARMVDAGATFFTHLGNGLPNRIHRHHNPIWAALANDDLAITIITDGHHLPPSAIKTMIRAKGVAKTAVVSDASHLAGLPPGRYSTPDNEVILLEPSGKLHNPQKECLVGSSATMMQCMNHLASLGILTAEELLAVGFHNPLRLIAAEPADLRAEGAIHYDEQARVFSI
jgi:N-acetylglucosamine-6-phosphate deacetylase